MFLTNGEREQLLTLARKYRDEVAVRFKKLDKLLGDNEDGPRFEELCDLQDAEFIADAFVELVEDHA